MNTYNGKIKVKAFVVVSLMILLAVSVLAGTVYAVTLDITDAQPVAAGIGSVGDGASRQFSWTIDTSQDSYFKPVTNISGKLGGADNSTQNVTTTGYSGNLYDNAVTVTLGGDTSGSSAFYNTNLVYTLTDPSCNTEYAKFRIFQDTIIPVGCDQATLDNYVSGLTVRDVADTYGVCETLTFTLSVPENGMSVTSMPMYTYIPVEIRQRIVDENGNYLRDADSSITTSVTRYQYDSHNSTDYTNNKYFYISDAEDYYDNLTAASPSYVQENFNAAGASIKLWMAKGYRYNGLITRPQTAEGFTYHSLTYEVKSRTGETVGSRSFTGNNIYSSGFGPHDNMSGPNENEQDSTWMEYGGCNEWDSAYVAADKITVYINYTQNSSYVPVVTPGSTYSITVKSHFEDAVNDDEHSQYIEIYNDTTQNPIARTKNHVAAAMPVGNTTPAINVKSNSKVSVKSITVKDANGTNITVQAFGYEQYYTDFIESCKTSLFGFVELQNITGNITVDVTYGEPVADKSMGSEGSNLYYSMTVVTKGDVGPYNKAYRNDYQYQDISLGYYSTYNVDTSTMDTTRSANSIFNQNGHYPMRDGGQITRYDYGNGKAVFDCSVYSYIYDIKMYYNDTGAEVEDISSLAGRKMAYNSAGKTYNGNSGRSITYVVTYKKFESTTVYAKIDAPGGRSESRCIVAEGDENAYFADYYSAGYSSNIYSAGIDENETPLSRTTQTSGYYGKFTVLDSDSIKFRLKNENANSMKFSDVKVYALDVNTDTAGEQLAGDGCDNPQLTIEYSPDRTDWQSDGWVKISGLRNYGGNIYVTANDYRYNTMVNLRSSGEHTDSFSITANDSFGAISGSGQSGDDSNMKTFLTKPATEGSTVHWMYGGAYYTVKSDGEETLQKVTVTYYQLPNGASKTLTFDQKNQDGSITIDYPADNYYYNSANTNITVYFDPVEAHEAQVYMTASGVPVTNSYFLRYNSAKMVEVSTFDNGTPSAELFNTTSGTTSSYQSKQFEKITSNNENSNTYKIAKGTTVKVKNVFVEESRAVSSTLPQTLKDFVNRRFTFKGVKVYKVNSFSHNGSGGADLGDEITVTKDGDYYVFTMPESGVRIVPEYDQHVRAVNVLSNQRNDNGNTYSIKSSTLGTATLTGDENNWFIIKSWYDCDDYYDNTNYAGHEWGAYRTLTLDSSSFTLTATPANSDDYIAKSVKAYKYPYTYTAQNNNIFQDNMTDSTYNWLTYDNEGNITNEEIPNVAGAFGDPDANGARSCTVTLPDNLDVGNIVLWVEFAPKESTAFAHFKYESDTTSEAAFNPIVNISGIFTGDHSGFTSVPATDGADVQAAVYDENSAQCVNLVLGGNTQMNSAFYRYNLIYTLSDYTTGSELVKFRVYKDQVIPIGSYTSEDVNRYLNVNACTYEDASPDTQTPTSSYVCEKATIPFKLTTNGFKLSYQSERLYIPVTVKQYVKRFGSDEYTAANNDFTADLTKYFENTSNLSDFAVNKYFAKAKITDDNYGDSYGLNTALNSDFTDFYTTTGAEESLFMLIENHGSYWQGFHIQPNAPSGYRVSDTGMAIKTYNSQNAESSLGAYITANQEIYDQGQGYRVQYHAENSQSANGEYLTYMGGQRIEISLFYEETEDLYAGFTYALADSGAYRPSVKLKGSILYDADDVVDATGGKAITTAVYKSESTDPKLLTVEIGGHDDRDSIFHEANLVYTLTDKTTNSEVMKFRIYRGQVIRIGYSDEQAEQYLASGTVETYNASQYDGMMEKATLQIKVPENGLIMTYSYEPVYLPITVKQYVLDQNGDASAAGSSFTSLITKKSGSSNDYSQNKYFAADGTLTDSYGLGTANQSKFTDSYTVTGETDTHYMYYRDSSEGIYIKPDAPEGYSLATIRAKALNKNGEIITKNQNLTTVPTYNDSQKGYTVEYNAWGIKYLQGATIEVAVYFQPTTTLTLKQTYVGSLSGSLPSINITNSNSEAPTWPFKPFLFDSPDSSTDAEMKDSVALTNTQSNVNEQDLENHPNERYRTTVIGLAKGTKPSVKVSLAGARNVASIKLYKKNGAVYEEVPADGYTLTGTGAVNSSITLTLNSAAEFSDDYFLDILYGNQKTFTVKAAMMSDGNQILTGSDYNYSLTKADIAVSGQVVAANGDELEDMPFTPTGGGDGINSFTVTQDAKTYNTVTNTRVTVNTSIDSSSNYVIANVRAFDDRNNDLNLVTPTTVYDKQSGKPLGTTYETCTLPGLTSDDNVTLIVYLAKVADVKVSVYTVGDDGVTIVNGVPHGAGDNGVNITNSYVNVSVIDGNSLNKNAIITADNEGHYYTGDFDVTFDPYERNVKVLQGSNLKIFAQIPNDGRGKYVVKKVVSNGTGYANASVGDVSRFEDSDDSDNLRVNINTGNERIDANKNYEIKIYLEKAKSIYTRAVNVGGNTVTSTSGEITVRGVPAETGVLPFTVVAPSNRTAYQYYDAVTTYSSLNYTSEARCVRGTALSFDVKPQDNYEISSITVKRGNTKDTAQPINFEMTAQNEDTGVTTYTITDPMNYLYNIYIDVEFTVTKWGRVTIDYQYTDDYVNYKYYVSPTEGISTLGLSTYWGPSIDRIRDGEEYFNSKSDIQFEKTHTYEVIAGTEFRTSTTAQTNGKWYMAAEIWVYDNNANKIRNRYSSGISSGFGLDAWVNGGDDLTFHIRLVPGASIGGIEVNNNCYDDNPNGVKKTDEGSVRVSAHFVDSDSYPVKPPAAMYVYPACSWTNSFSFGYNGDIVANAQLDTVSIDYEYMIKPGKVRSVTVYEFSKEPGQGVTSLGNVVTSHTNIDVTKAKRHWDITKYGVLDDDKRYMDYNITSEKIVTMPDMVYRVYVDYDLINVKGNSGNYFSTYLDYAGNTSVINLENGVNDSANVKLLSTRLDQSYATKGGNAYFVVVSKLPATEYELTNGTFYDYKTQQTINITNDLVESYTTRTTQSGITRYYYFYQINPDDRYAVDNSMEFYVSFTQKTEHPSVPTEENLDCDITVEQWNRNTYDGQYVAADNQSVRFSAPEGSVLMNRETGVSSNPLTVTKSKDTLFSQRRTELTIKPIPYTGYNVERVVITDSGRGYYYPDSNGEIKHTLSSNNVKIEVYYSRPLLRISATNEGVASKAQVDVYNSTEQSTTTVLDSNTFTSGVFVTKNDDAMIVIRPIQYQSGSTLKYYTVASIRVGDIYDNTTTVYTEDGGVMTGYDVQKTADGSEFILTINNIQKDKYIFIQLRGDETVLSSSLQVNQKIKLPGSKDYVDCMENYFGTVVTTGTLSEVEAPLNFDGVDCASYTLSNKASAEGTVLYNTALSFTATPPEGYIVKSVEARINGDSVNIIENNGVYTLDTNAPNSGATVITVKYALPTTPYTLTYTYQGRKGGNNGGNYGGDDAETDPKTYTVDVDLYPADLTEDGKPTQRAIADNAPAVDDLYKDCKWTITENESDTVKYDTENNKVDVTATQSPKTYNVEFFYTTGKDQADVVLNDVKLNSLAKDSEGKFIQAPEKSGDNSFGYWSVVENDKEIARCYNRDFNLRVTGNYKITAMYTAAANVLSISDPRYTRQQYDNEDGTHVDKLQVDFLLAYMESNGLLLNSDLASQNGYSSGIVVEYFDDFKIDKDDEIGGTLTDDDKAKVVLPKTAESALKTFIESASNSSTNEKQHLLKYTVPNSYYNNKNRVDRAIKFNNSEGARQMVFRAYYYVSHVEGEETVTELTNPVTFYLYDIGNSQSTTEEG